MFYIVLSSNIITLHKETNIGICVEEKWGGGGLLLLVSTGRLHPKGPCTFFRFQVYERVGKTVIC